MCSKWTIQTYQIKQHADGQILTEQVFCWTSEGFGIHRTGNGWSVTHLKSGWATFMSRTEEGAKIIADYLIGSYAAEFERLNISDYAVENFRLLAERIGADELLCNLRRLYVIPQRELNRNRTEPQPRLEVLS